MSPFLYNYSSVGLCTSFHPSALSYFHSSTVIFSLNWKWVQWPPDDIDAVQPPLYSKTEHALFLVWHFFVLIRRIQFQAHLFCLASGVCQAAQPLKCRFDGSTKSEAFVHCLSRELLPSDFKFEEDTRLFQDIGMFLRNKNHIYAYIYFPSVCEVRFIWSRVIDALQG